MPKPNNKEKRQFNRLSVYHLVKYKPFLDASKDLPAVISMAKNISAGGLCLRIQEYFPVHTLLEIAIKFPTFEEPISTLAEVSWVSRKSKSEYYDTGVRFVDIEESVRGVMAKQIDYVLTKLNIKPQRFIPTRATPI